MTAIAEALKLQLEQLSSDERAELASYLIDSLDPGEDPNAASAWSAELRRRSDEILRGDVQGENANEVFSRLHARFS